MAGSVRFVHGGDKSSRTNQLSTDLDKKIDNRAVTVQRSLAEKGYLGLAKVFRGKPRPREEISTAMVEVDDEVSAFLAQPKVTIKYPGIVMIHEWWGLNDQIKSMAHILAREGYVVLAPDLFRGRIARSREDAKLNVKENRMKTNLSGGVLEIIAYG